MPRRFQKRPWDLIVAFAYTILVSATILALGHGAWWAVLLVLFFPGYVVVAALFPGQGLSSRLKALVKEGDELRAAARSRGVNLNEYRTELARAQDAAKEKRLSEAVAILGEANARVRALLEKKTRPGRVGSGVRLPAPVPEASPGREIDWVERITLSFGLSIALASLLGILLNFTPWGIRFDSIVVLLLLFTVLVGIVAFERRMRLPVEDRLSATFAFAGPEMGPSSGWDKAAAAALVASILFLASVLVYVAITPRPTEHFTQFFILNRNGTADPTLYPTNLSVSEPGTVIVRVVNNESVQVNYTVWIDLVGVNFVRNATSGLNETIEVNRTPMKMFQFDLGDRGMWEQSFTFIIDASGSWKLDFLLFRDGDLSKAYRNAFFFVDVGSPP